MNYKKNLIEFLFDERRFSNRRLSFEIINIFSRRILNRVELILNALIGFMTREVSEQMLTDAYSISLLFII